MLLTFRLSERVCPCHYSPFIHHFYLTLIFPFLLLFIYRRTPADPENTNTHKRFNRMGFLEALVGNHFDTLDSWSRRCCRAAGFACFKWSVYDMMLLYSMYCVKQNVAQNHGCRMLYLLTTMSSNSFLLVIFTVPLPICLMLSEFLLDDLLLSGVYYTEHVFYSVL